MHPDRYRTLVREENWPSCIGDSAWETGFWKHACDSIGIKCDAGLTSFVTLTGFVRHEDAPIDGIQTAPAMYPNAGEPVTIKTTWRERDTSTDQLKGLWYGSAKDYPWIQVKIYERVKDNWWRSGNNQLIDPGFFFELIGWRWAVSICLLIQLLIFKLSFRWNDGLKKFEFKTSAGDMITWYHQATGKPAWLRALMPGQRLGDALKEYYQSEPNSEWLLSIHYHHVAKFFSPYFGYLDRYRELKARG